MSGTSWVCVGGQFSQGICQSGNGTTWFGQFALFSTNDQTFVTSNSVIWDGHQFLTVGGSTVATSPDGQDPWTNNPLNSGNGNVITFDKTNTLYYVGCTDGTVLKASTIAGLASATPKSISAHNLRCAASSMGTTLMGDDAGGMFSTVNQGVTWVSEVTGLGSAVLTSLATHL